MGRLIIGLGTGRCGTRSLARFLNLQDVCTKHEGRYMLWVPDNSRCDQYIDKKLEANKVFADVGFYWINYVDHLHEKYDAKFICLKRKKDDVIRSFMRSNIFPMQGKILFEMMEKYNMPKKYCDYVTQKDLDAMDEGTREFVESYWEHPMVDYQVFQSFFPKYDIGNKKEYLSYYYDEYYQMAEKFKEKFPTDFIIMDLNEALNTKTGREEILNFIGVCPSPQVQWEEIWLK